MIYYMGFPVTVTHLIRPRTVKYVAKYRRDLDAIVTIELSNGDTREVKAQDLRESNAGEIDAAIAELQHQEE